MVTTMPRVTFSVTFGEPPNWMFSRPTGLAMILGFLGLNTAGAKAVKIATKIMMKIIVAQSFLSYLLLNYLYNTELSLLLFPQFLNQRLTNKPALFFIGKSYD